MNSKRLVMFGSLLVLAVIILVSVVSYGNRTRPAEVPDAITVTGLGAPILNDPEIRAILEQPWTDPNGEVLPAIYVDTKYAGLSTSKMISFNNGDFTGIDFVQAGDSYYANLWRASNPNVKVVSTSVVYNTKLMMYTWWRYLPAFINSGYVVKVDNYYYMPPEKACQLLNIQYNQYISGTGTWGDAGIVFDDPYITNSAVDLNAPSYGSSTGIEEIAWMANCFAGDINRAADISQINQVMPYLEAYVRQQGGQGSSSLGSFKDFWTSGEGVVTFVSYDSALPTVAGENGYPLDLLVCLTSDPATSDPGKCKKDNHPVGIYLGGGTPAQHTFMTLTDNGQLLIRRLADPRIQKIAWEKLGAATPAVVMYDAPVSWMSTTVPQGNKPADAFYEAFLSGLDAIFKK